MNPEIEPLSDIIAERDSFLLNLQKTVFAIITLYFFVFLFFGARLSAVTVAIGIFFLAPLTYKLQISQKKTAAKLLFLASCNFYIYGASYGLQHEFSFEYFFPAAMMLTLLIFNPTETANIAFGFIVPLVGWAIMSWGPHPEDLGPWLAERLPQQGLKHFNFCCAYAIVAVFLSLYIKSLARLQDYSLRTANASRDNLSAALDVVRASEASLAEAQKLAKIGNWAMDLNTKRVTWSPQMYGIFPRTPDQGEPTLEELHDIIHPEDREEWARIAKKYMEIGGSYVVQYRIIHPDRVVWVEVRGQTHFENGKVPLVQGTCQDISEQKAVQEGLKQVNAWRQAIIDASPFAILAADSSGLTTVCNQAAERLLESSKESILTRDSMSFFDPEQFSGSDDHGTTSRDVHHFAARMTSLFGITTDGQFDFKEFTIINAIHQKVPIRLCISYIFDTNGTHTGYLYIMEDLTEQKRLLRTIEAQNEKILSSAKMSSLGEMAGGIAHEINNPLAIIHGRAGQLKRLIESGHALDDSAKLSQISDGLSKIEKTVDRIAKIIHGLRAFSRNSEQDNMQIVPVARVIEDTLELCGERFKNNSIDLRLENPVEAYLQCRSVQISQVLMNLLNNAFDAVEHLGEKWVSIQTMTENERLIIAVTDSGQGIPHDVAEKMMQPFFTTKEMGKGTGLGLGISVGIIEAHNGQLFYDTTAKHTRFVIELPRHEAPQTNSDPTKAA